ncbi:uncharacterized protein Z518_09032 [Rhinocladiella mackenziei CBS 650.93]|uniref:Amino acid permease/ SLC12A domain-containing protein n=1 Tax=Rhinocladiella mackenziei CBS 650.93 TaxID=1442369 RepID=A0A0D2FGZ2_9EURO|nr:uncharacterized protein Z518_09032 [Rhinocladiella mackenziei CBS 650.93]KIX01307.1 hypothetical protein Z518_09032 [Rhinocladiella mackenziei CBS 650.93]
MADFGKQQTPALPAKRFIALGGIIGVGFFRGSSSTTALAGPGGAMIAVFVIGIIVIAIMEGICELINIWPIPNAMVEFVRSFVDEDLGIAVGILYWYTYCVSFSALIIVAGDLTKYWGLSHAWKSLTFAAAPWILLAINAAPVNVFGWVEFVGGVLKLCLVVGIIILMCLINAGGCTIHHPTQVQS